MSILELQPRTCSVDTGPAVVAGAIQPPDISVLDFAPGCEVRRCSDEAELVVTVQACCGTVARLSCVRHYEQTLDITDRFWTCHHCGRARWIARSAILAEPIGGTP